MLWSTIILLLFVLSAFVSATLLFWIEPMFAKMILPLFGGTPAVWNTCIVFYQVVLLAGYVYAHVVTRWFVPPLQAILHTGLLFSVFITLPTGVTCGSTSLIHTNPIPQLFGMMTVVLGLPFFVISTSSPLLQKWLTTTSHPSAKDPYFLYSVSNLGSMIGLLGYPLIIESNLPLADQAKVWAGGYGVLAGLFTSCAVIVLMTYRSSADNLNQKTGSQWRNSNLQTVSGGLPHLKVSQRIRWALLAFVPSSLLLGVTNFITTDIAPVPLLWIIPLTVYLITFILTFAPKPLLRHRLMVNVQPFLLLPIIILFYWDLSIGIFSLWLIPLHVIAFFVTSMVCHGELAQSRPPSIYLTEFYIWVSVGGILGGLFNVIVAPIIFNNLAEYPLAIGVAGLLRPPVDSERRNPLEHWLDVCVPFVITVLFWTFKFGLGRLVPLSCLMRFEDISRLTLMTIVLISFLILIFLFYVRRRPIRLGLSILGISVAGVFFASEQNPVLYSERNFFGVLKVMNEPKSNFCFLFHGTTLHGAQNRSPGLSREPLTYYHRTGPLGQLFAALSEGKDKKRVAVIGLGTGTMACYSKPGQSWTFYEINPAVEHIARDDCFFTFLRESPAQVDVVIGDARQSLTKEAKGYYDLIVLDAFNSDSIPIHLLTREAIHLYLSKLAKDGLLVFHVSNRYLNLKSVLGDLSRDANMVCLVQEGMKLSEAEEREMKCPSDWVIMARSTLYLGNLVNDKRWKPLLGRTGARLWTDDFSNILGILKWRFL